MQNEICGKSKYRRYCPGVGVPMCSPASGSIFPVGTTSVNCIVTDGGGNQANCSFKVTIFDVRLQDDSDSKIVILFNSFTGEYRLCCPALPQPVTGQGTIMKQGCISTLQHNAADRKLLAKCDPGIGKGSATYQSPPGQLKCTITDKDITNNTGLCQ